MRDDDDPASGAKICSNRLGIATLATAFEPMQEQQRGCMFSEAELLLLCFSEPARGRSMAKPWVLVAFGLRDQARRGPIQIDVVAIGRVVPCSHESEAICGRNQRAKQCLCMTFGQPVWGLTRGEIEGGSHYEIGLVQKPRCIREFECANLLGRGRGVVHDQTPASRALVINVGRITVGNFGALLPAHGDLLD